MPAAELDAAPRPPAADRAFEACTLALIGPVP